MIRRLICWLGFHEWYTRKKWRVNLEKGTAKYEPDIWCKYCGKVKK